MSNPHILIIGGGAGGLELATQLGDKLGRRNRAQITLVDRNSTHLWKPLLHEVATGALDAGIDALSYRAQAANHHFEFQLGSLVDVDRAQKQVVLAPIVDEQGQEIVAQRRITYDYLVLAIGSISNDFNTKGVRDHCIFLDSPAQAERFHKALMNAFLALSSRSGGGNLEVAIVGGGATGVELSAELHKAAEVLSSYGFAAVGRERLKVTLVEAGPRLLPALPERISASAHKELSDLGVSVRTDTMVTEARADGLVTKSGEIVPAGLMVWAAGIKCPDFLGQLAGLEANRNNQLLVKPTLQTSNDDAIFAIGDCASCARPEGGFVPPRAQAAHQMASQVYRNILALLNGRPLSAYIYKDHGSLVSLSKYSTVGSLMGNLTRGSMMVEGRLARVVYISLYRMHQIALHGYIRTGLMMLVGGLNRALRPTLKLH